MKSPPGRPSGAIAPERSITLPSARERPMQRLLLAGCPDFWRLWSVGLVVFTVRWLETVAVGVFHHGVGIGWIAMHCADSTALASHLIGPPQPAPHEGIGASSSNTDIRPSRLRQAVKPLKLRVPFCGVDVPVP